MHEILILTGSHLCHNPRVFKEASALANAGFDVEVLGAWMDKKLKAGDIELQKMIPFRFTPVMDLTSPGNVVRFHRQVCRIRGKSAQLAYRYCGLQSRWQLGYTVGALGRFARSRTAGLFIVHSEAGLAVAKGLLDSGVRVGVDMEDWFSEDLPPEARAKRPIRLLHDMERSLLGRGGYATCPSRAMSEELSREYGCPAPKVVYNAFPWSDRKSIEGRLKDRKDCSVPSIHWYSQTIGPGRGLEDLFGALPLLSRKVEVHLRGNPAAGFDEWMASYAPEEARERIFLHGLVSNQELLSRIAEHDIGFAGEMKYCRSRVLTVSNKILHFLLAGLAVVASDTAGQKEVADKADGAVCLYPSGDHVALAGVLNDLLGAKERLQSAKEAALRAARETFCWERQEKVLIESVEAALSKPKAQL